MPWPDRPFVLLTFWGLAALVLILLTITET